MPFYETTIIVRQDASTQQVEKLGEDIKKILEENEGRLTKQENWGLRQLAYRVKKYRKAHYLYLNMEASPTALTQIEYMLRYQEDVLRYLTVRVDSLSDEPSAMMQSRGRGERGDRGDRGDRGERRGGDRFGDRGERGDRGDRFERRERPERTER